ncbi:hypothetical protein M9H77_12605 [Catharanthus roseus]|uniref:Uncharacterized protein n=1 Tax=Catharanthus roseus TaxID=4058 RepID=A0ACC0BHU6_CATRO|nr:hypothetical protein M9H77_12605 [Catharanthus roseus]
MASVVIREPSSSPSQMAVVMKKVQMIIRNRRDAVPRSMYRTEVLVELREVLGDILGVEQEVDDLLFPITSQWIRKVTVASRARFRICLISITTFYILRVFGFRTPPPPGTSGSFTLYQPISEASSSDEEEREEDMDGVQHFGFGHRVGKKNVRFTPSDWP